MVQDRFYALLKYRLQAEIQKKPPLFPWETEVLDYADVGVWAPQLQTLRLPVALPEPVLAQLFQQCQQVVQTVQKQGLQLIRAVEDLFPENQNKLNDFAGMVLLGASRDQERSRTWLLGAEPPTSYDQAPPSQRVILAMMAAQDLLDQVTLTLSPLEPRVSRHWQTELGSVDLTATYTGLKGGEGRLDLGANLPGAGQVSIGAGETVISVKRETAGIVTLVVPGAEVDRTYPLDIAMHEADAPLKFVIRVQQDLQER